MKKGVNIVNWLNNVNEGRKNVQVDYERGRRVVGGKRKDGEVGRPKGRTRTRKGLRK